ncbi:MAG: hypothetical protein GY799_29580 [Desulfobulbaceae bacterium]|nr:hypothetical protein [Desulfobulbaceae bacterium]
MNTASQAIISQQTTIAHAIELLQGKLESLTDSVNPDTASWRDVAEFAQTADMAAEIIARFEES